ncbi:AIPR family protein [Mediterraneibacter faecis]|uniref:AIPR family protein n=1 Tax=Mediterraneibacter faecis TaxID=592978 RepID=UPI001D00A560|nr:AIPR family protein [Mediterraneibacter faecis]MCB5431317.1 AIPR family protein [Mediterraneibacter faecis]
MDRITQSMIDSFKSNQSLNIDDDSELFEYFVNYCVVNNVYGSNDFDLEEITTGKATQGIDGIAIIVNQKFVNTIEDIDTLIEYNKSISVKFVLIQAKTSSSFDNTEIGNLLTYSKLFFSDDTSMFRTAEMQHFIELKEYIFSKGDKLKKNPELFLYYVTLGTWTDDENLRATISVGKESLRGTNLFSNISFEPCGSEKIQDLYRKTKEKLKATFKFEKRITMYSINDDEVGYSGVLPFKEFKKLIIDENGATKAVFEDNIRDYLGPNPDVNKNITETIKTGNVNAFSMLNNGITVVTSSIIISGDIATIEDYQIVNGCQTSNVLIENMDSVEGIDELIIPIRIIATKDENLKNDITRATNSQTAIKKDQLEALSTFQKKLEEYYKTYRDEDALVYERRTGQYRDSNIPKNRIITIAMQIKTVAAMFLDEPSGVSGQYGTVAKRVGNKIFKTADKEIIYYVSSLALYKIENLFRTHKIDKKYRRARYHAMMLFRMLVSTEKMPRFNARKMENYCKNILEVLENNAECERIFCGIVAYIASKDGELDIMDRKCFERKETTEYLKNRLDEIKIFVDTYSISEQ